MPGSKPSLCDLPRESHPVRAGVEGKEKGEQGEMTEREREVRIMEPLAGNHSKIKGLCFDTILKQLQKERNHRQPWLMCEPARGRKNSRSQEMQSLQEPTGTNASPERQDAQPQTAADSGGPRRPLEWPQQSPPAFVSSLICFDENVLVFALPDASRI